MSTTLPVAPAKRSVRPLKVITLSALIVAALAFIAMYAVYYFLNYSQAAYAARQVPYYWPERFWLLTHIACGSIAIVTGPPLFSRSLRQRWTRLHRVLGRVYLIAVLFGGLASMYLATHTALGWGFGFGLFVLALVWLTCSAMAFYAIRLRQIQIHREWMIRSYITTFAFVTFRVLIDFGPTSQLPGMLTRYDVFAWASWAIPMMAFEVWLQLRRMRAMRAVR